METITLEGILRIYAFPSDEAQQDLMGVWTRLRLIEKIKEVERNGGGLTFEGHNLFTSAGRTQILTYMGTASGTPPLLAQYFAVGTGTIAYVNASDTTVAGELFRAAPASLTVVGNAVTVTTNFTTTQAVGTYTNAGLFGNGATGAGGSGTLMTHLLYSYTKNNSTAIVNDYSLSLT